MQIENNKVVQFEYTLTDPKGRVLDSSEGGAPLVYMHGTGGIVPGLERAMTGKQEGDAFEVLVPAAQGYGERDDDQVQIVPLAQFNPKQPPKPGMQFQVTNGTDVKLLTVVAVEKGQVIVDANHPLSGIDLKFAVTVRGVRDATAEEKKKLAERERAVAEAKAKAEAQQAGSVAPEDLEAQALGGSAPPSDGDPGDDEAPTAN